jgi:hypothetical protein
MFETGKKTLLSYSAPFDLSKRGSGWVTSEENLDDVAADLDFSRHFLLIPNKQRRFLRGADAMEIRAGKLVEWERRNPRT